jgi:hypothetical protein
MPAGFEIGDHCMFVIDMLMESIVGLEPQRIVFPKARQLNSKIPGEAAAYRARLKYPLLRHRMIEQLGRAHEESIDNMEAEKRINVIVREGGHYMTSVEKKCQKIKSGRILFSPEATVWIGRCQIYHSILRYHNRKVCNRGNLKRTAKQFRIQDPLNLPLEEVHAQLQMCKEQCEYFRQHGHRYRQKHLQNRLNHAWETNDETAEKVILAIINSKHDRAQWKSLNAAMKRQRRRSEQVIQVEQEDGAIQEYTWKDEVHTAIWSNIHRKHCMTEEVAPTVIAIILHTLATTQAWRQDNIWDVLQSWGCCWIWEDLRMVGKDD